MKNQYLDVAKAIASDLLNDAIHYEDNCTWMSMVNDNIGGQQKEEFNLVDTTFYAGTSGIAYFLTDLYRIEKDKELEEVILAALRLSYKNRVKIEPNMRLGFHSGWVGLLFSVYYAAVIMHSNELLEIYEELLNEIVTGDYIKNSELDLIVGGAGAIPVLIALYNHRRSSQLRNFIKEISEYLIDKAEVDENEIQWETFSGLDNNLTGYAHGAAGFFHAFMEMYNWTEESKYLELAKKIEAYENGHYDDKEKNWPDFRSYNEEKKEHGFFCGWCHGAPGIGMSRLRALEITSDSSYLEQVENAMINMKRHSSVDKMGYSLCHGFAGNAVLTLDHYIHTQNQSSLAYCEDIASKVVINYTEKEAPFLNGVGSYYRVPELMTGIAGLGHFMLRMYDKEVPSILLIRSDHFAGIETDSLTKPGVTASLFIAPQ